MMIRDPAPATDIQQAAQQMVTTQLVGRGIRDPRVLSAMASVPREQFVPDGLRVRAFADQALPIACGQTISQPYIVALMSEALEVSDAHRVLEIGTGCGYQTAVLAELAGHVVSVERHPELHSEAAARLMRLGYVPTRVELHCADGGQGWPHGAPYDRILVAAAIERCPEALIEQLAVGGRLVIPLGDRDGQVLTLIEKSGSGSQQTELAECRFVPLVRGSVDA